MSETQGVARPPRRWLKRIGIGVGVYLLVGFLTSFLGFNLLGAVSMSGPLVGRVVDVNGRSMPGAFVSYEWKGRSFHGATGCKAAAVVRSGVGGIYFVPWQGWRLVFATGWGISPAGPAVWAPGYVAKNGPNATTIYVPENDPAALYGSDSTNSVDKGSCFGWPYRLQWIELRSERFRHSFARICNERSSLRVVDLGSLLSAAKGVSIALKGDFSLSSTSTAALARKYDGSLRRMAWPRSEYDPDAVATAEQRDEFCASVKQEFLALGGRLDEE